MLNHVSVSVERDVVVLNIVNDRMVAVTLTSKGVEVIVASDPRRSEPTMKKIAWPKMSRVTKAIKLQQGASDE